MSVIVVGPRAAPFAAGPAGAGGGDRGRAAQGPGPAAGPVQPVRGGHPLHLPAHRGLRRGRAVPRRRGRAPGVPGHHQREPGRRAGRAPHRAVRRRRDQPPLHRGRRARLGRARGVRGAGPGPPGLGAGPTGAGVRAGARRAVPPRRGDRQAGPVGDGHRPGDHLAVPRSGGPGHRADGRADWPGPGSSWSGRARWARGWSRPWPATARPPWSSPTAPPIGPRRWSPACRHRWPTGSPRRRSRASGSSAGRRRRGLHLGGDDPPVIDRPMLEAAAAGRPADAPLLVVDLGVPRNVDPSAAGLDGVVLLDMDVLRAAVADALSGRQEEVAGRHSHRDRRGGALPGGVPGPRRRPDGVGPAGPGRGGPAGRRSSASGRRRSELSDAQWEQVDAVTRSMVAKLLHQPTVALKDAAGTPRGERLVEALRTLFDL